MLTALIPYFEGVSPAAHSRVSLRKGYLARTVDSLRGFADVVRVGRLEEFPGEPQWLPARMFRHYQGKLLYGDLVYCTEADQILHYGYGIPKVEGDNYLVPFRVERGTRQENRFGGAFLCTVELFKKVVFKDMEESPVEHATGLDIARVGNLMQDPEFWVDHLSAQEYRA